MILVDTLAWIDHLRAGDAELTVRLNGSHVLMHPFVLGELACGDLRNCSEVLALLKGLPRAAIATGEEVLFFIERPELMDRGICYVDAHLLAAAAIGGATRLWTRDKRLRTVADALALAYENA